MDNPTDQLIEEALTAIKRGELTPEMGPTRYRADWVKMEPHIQMALKLEKNGQTFKAQLPPLNLDRAWRKIELGIGKTTVTPSADSGANPGLSPTTPDRTVVLSPGPGPVSKPKPPAKLADWRRRPLSWAAALALFVTISFGSVAGIAQAADPGDSLYDFKLWLEDAGQVLDFSAEEKAQAALNFADHRLAEIEKLSKSGRFEYIGLVLNKYDGAITKVKASSPTLNSNELQVLVSQQSRLTQLKGTLTSLPAGPKVVQTLDHANKQIDSLNPTPVPTTTTIPTVSPAPTTEVPVTPSITTKTTTSATTIPTTPGVTTPATTAPVNPEKTTALTSALTPVPVPTTLANSPSNSNSDQNNNAGQNQNTDQGQNNSKPVLPVKPATPVSNPVTQNDIVKTQPPRVDPPKPPDTPQSQDIVNTPPKTELPKTNPTPKNDKGNGNKDKGGGNNGNSDNSNNGGSKGKGNDNGNKNKGGNK